MREPPADLSHDTLCAVLRARYGLTAAGLTFLPLGHDAYAWVYRLHAAGETYFLKARRGAVNEPGLVVPHYLHSLGISEVIAPIPATDGRLWAEAGAYALVLYPYVEGRTGKDGGMTPTQWIEYGAVLRRIHAASPPPDLARRMRREPFVPEGPAEVRAVEAHLAGDGAADPLARSAAAFWAARREEIQVVTERAEDLGRRLAERPPPSVLCHADIHTANVLVEASGRMWIVDWDETVLAPRERDLMFVAGGGISDRLVRPRDEALFFQGYGGVTLDPLALAYYRYAWAVSDIGAYGAQVFLRPDLGPADREESVERLLSLFEAGEIVAKALAS